ncbi:TadA family conjugal transfer-associated ATPase [Motilibacter sp. E257]|uniref:TadA family conjugal transfer-associated ATPase n=1 Tax=Motilibacter deserti TaxID=2714956 RepID=A0ABX0H0K8_9ACTN|nr:TadA family conjugal transfer-associated ATPase [Motilibacter deserti]
MSRLAHTDDRPDAALLERVRSRLVGHGAAPNAVLSAADVAEALRAERGLLGDGPVLAVAAALRAELAGLGPLQPLLADPRVTDVLVNGPADVWVDRGGGLERVDARFADEADVRRIAERLATSAGRRLDDGAPWVEARLPQGLRLHAVIPPVAVGGTHLSLRVPARTPLSLAQLAAAGAVTPLVEQTLRDLVAARASLLVTGGTGAGKTTLLAALLGLVPDDERIVIAEDTAELDPDHPHVVRLEGRAANVEGAGEVQLRQLVRQALRMRPDRLVVGEVRGAEVVDLLAALNTGHDGGSGTLHANAAEDVPARVEALATSAGLSREAVASQLGAALDAVVHVARGRDGRRHVASVGVLVRRRDGLCAVVEALSPRGEGPGAEQLASLLARAGG